MATTGIKAVNADRFNKSRYNNSCFIFLDDLSCNDSVKENADRCNAFKERTNLAVYGNIDSKMIKIFNDKFYLNYTLYQVI
jgi:hypothetical protein